MTVELLDVLRVYLEAEGADQAVFLADADSCLVLAAKVRAVAATMAPLQRRRAFGVPGPVDFPAHLYGAEVVALPELGGKWSLVLNGHVRLRGDLRPGSWVITNGPAQ